MRDLAKIIDGLENRGYLGPCAKLQTKCFIVTIDDEKFIGENWCASPQKECPREEGEGYEKCKTICKQLGHAEQVAVELAGEKAKGGTAHVVGHSYVCRECQEALYGAGIKYISMVGESNEIS